MHTLEISRATILNRALDLRAQLRAQQLRHVHLTRRALYARALRARLAAAAAQVAVGHGPAFGLGDLGERLGGMRSMFSAARPLHSWPPEYPEARLDPVCHTKKCVCEINGGAAACSG